MVPSVAPEAASEVSAEEPTPRRESRGRDESDRPSLWRVANTHNQCSSALTFQPVSSGTTTGLVRTVSHSAAYVGWPWAAAR
jgi:hypothetical protein